MKNLHLIGAKEAVRKIKNKKIKAEDLVADCLWQIKKREPRVKAWVLLDKDYAIKQARAIDKRISLGQDPGLLAGVPVGVKDIFNTFDFPTEMGSPIWKGFTPGNDARVVSYLRWQGAVIPGKTVTAEFAVHTPGPTHNPHRYGYMTGTSSSGSAAAVAAFMVPLAIGTQTAGSTIRPASYCGIYGMKPSFGLLPRTGMLKTTDSLDTIGFFSRSVDDLELLFEVLRVRGIDHPISEKKLKSYRQQKKKTWRVGVVTSSLWVWEKAEPYAKRAITAFARNLSREPWLRISEVKLPKDFNEAHRIHPTIYDKTLSYYFKEEFRRKKLVSKIMCEIIKHGQKISVTEYQRALEEQEELAQKFERFMKDFDILLALSTGGEALKGLDSVDRPDSCLVWTLCYAPTINLPVFKGPEGLPFGAQIVAKRYDDYNLLKFASLIKEPKLKADQK